MSFCHFCDACLSSKFTIKMFYQQANTCNLYKGFLCQNDVDK